MWSTSRVRSHRRAAAWTSIQATLGGNLVPALRRKPVRRSAAYAAKYHYSGRVEPPSARKLVPVPPPAILQERMRRLAEIGPALSAAHAAEQRPARSRSIPTWQDLLDEEDGGGLPVDSTPARDAREWAANETQATPARSSCRQTSRR